MDINPFSVRRWIHTPQIPDRRNFRFPCFNVLHWDYKDSTRFFEYEYFIGEYKIREIESSDAFAMLDMYDGITLIREEQDK